VVLVCRAKFLVWLAAQNSSRRKQQPKSRPINRVPSVACMQKPRRTPTLAKSSCFENRELRPSVWWRPSVRRRRVTPHFITIHATSKHASFPSAPGLIRGHRRSHRLAIQAHPDTKRNHAQLEHPQTGVPSRTYAGIPSICRRKAIDRAPPLVVNLRHKTQKRGGKAFASLLPEKK